MRSDKLVKVLHINTYDHGGGAEMIATLLLQQAPDDQMIVKKSLLQQQQVEEFPPHFMDRFFHFMDQLLWKLGIKKKFKRIFFIEDELNDTYSKLKKIRAYREADIIHLHNLHGGYFGLKALEKIAKEKKIVWTLHDMWCMTGGEAYVFDNTNYQVGNAFTPYKHLYPLRNSIIDRRQYYMNLKKRIYNNIAGSLVFVPVSRWLEDCLKSSYVYNNKMQTKVIYNGYDSRIFFPDRTESSQPVRILVFSSKSAFKGREIFSDVFKGLNASFELVVVGEQITLPGIPATFLPYIKDRKELARLYNSADLLLFPSKAEAFGLIPLEAMACGVCVFASNTGGLPELIRHGETGFLFNNTEELKTMMDRALGDPVLRRQIGEQAAEFVLQNFSEQKMYAGYQELYQSLL